MAFSDLKVRVNRVKNPRSKVVAMASLIIDDTLIVGGFRVLNGSKGLFVSPPSHKGKDSEGNEKWYDDVIFIDPKASDDAYKTPSQEEAYNLILAEYNRLSQNGGSSRSSSAQAHQTANQRQGGQQRPPVNPMSGNQGYDWGS